MNVDWTALALGAKLASAAYVRDERIAKQVLAALGFEFISIAGNGQCYVTLARKDGITYFLIRGTQVVSGFSLSQLLDNERVMPVNVAGIAGFAMDGYITPLEALYQAALRPFAQGPVKIVGHSMGGVRSLLMASLLPADIVCEITAFAPPKGADAAFWANAYQGRKPPLIVGRHDDFAPNHAIAASVAYGYCQPVQILDIGRDDDIACFVKDWPIWNESIPDHSDALYESDCAALAISSPSLTYPA